MKLKVCGLKHPHNIRDLIELPIDFMGFIFYEKSPRYIDQNLSFDFMRSIPKAIKKVGVFVNEKPYAIFNQIAHYDLDMVQLHGDETVEVCSELKNHVKVIKAFQINADFDFNNLEKYLPVVDYFLFDTPTVNYGGSGQSFNWEILKNYNYGVTKIKKNRC